MITIETSNENIELFYTLQNSYKNEVAILEKNNFIGDSNSIQIFITLSPIILTSICQVITALINANKEFTFKNDGKEISLKGFSERKIHEMMDTIYNKQDTHVDKEN